MIFLKKPINVRWLVSAVVIIVAVSGLVGYIQYFKYYPSTTDAYVNANVVYLASEVSGKVDKVLIHDHQSVTKGQLLLTLQPNQYIYARSRAKANYLLAKEQETVSAANIKSAADKLNQAKATLLVSRKKAGRLLMLLSHQQISKEAGDEATGQYHADRAAVNALNETLKAANIQYQISKEQTKVAKAQYDQALLNLKHTHILAPVSGTISNFSLRHGAYVTPGQSLFALVDTSQFWIDANFKETDLARIRLLQPVTVTLDMYPDMHLKGQVQSISRGSGATFSLLPPENATGNWVKVTQRFPVKITFELNRLDKQFPMRVGASAHVSVDTL